MVNSNYFLNDISKTVITVNLLKANDKGFLYDKGIGYRLKPVFKNHIFQFFNQIFKTVYLGDSWVDNITFIITKLKT
jgi:hypothetical protein